MKTFTIENETNKITLHASVKEAEEVPAAERFSSEAALEKLAAEWPGSRLVEIWNSLPGAMPVKKFKDRSTAVSRIWKAIQNLDAAMDDSASVELGAGVGPEPETAAAAVPDLIAEVVIGGPAESTDAPAADMTGPADVPAPVRGQAPCVAPDEASATEGASPADSEPTEPTGIDKQECSRLLNLAAAAQTAYRDALRNLEQALGSEFSDPGDLTSTTVEVLHERRIAERKRHARRTSAERTPRENSKTTQVIAMLRREGGATLDEIMTAMGWQKHTTRSMLSAGGALAKNHGLVITSENVGDQRRYSIKN